MNTLEIYNLQQGEIIYCNVTVQYKVGRKTETKRVDRVTLSRDYDKPMRLVLSLDKDKMLIDRLGLKCDCEIVGIELLHSSGFKVRI